MDDRIIVGKRLAGLNGTMLVSESGALPYFSGWRALDTMGINSEEIAHGDGITARIIEKMNPDLIMLFEQYGRYRPAIKRRKVVNQYMIDHEFLAVASTRKSFEQYHFYVVRKDSALFDDIVDRLLNIENIEYGDLNRQILEKRIPVYRE